MVERTLVRRHAVGEDRNGCRGVEGTVARIKSWTLRHALVGWHARSETRRAWHTHRRGCHVLLRTHGTPWECRGTCHAARHAASQDRNGWPSVEGTGSRVKSWM